MTKTTPNNISTPIPLSPDMICCVNFQGVEVNAYRHHLFRWIPHFKEMGNGQVRFVSCADRGSTPPLIMVSSFAWPPTDGNEHPGTSEVVITAPVTFLTRMHVHQSRFGENLWTLGTARKTVGYLAKEEGYDKLSRTITFNDVIKVLDVSSSGTYTETAGGGGEDEPAIGIVFSTAYPTLLERHGPPLSMDMDDARGRMAVSMSDGTLAIIEFV